MSRLSRYLRQHRQGGWLSFLLLGTKLCNAVLLLVGFAMLVYAGNLYLTQPLAPASPASWPPPLPDLPTLVFAVMGLLTSLSAVAAQAATSAHSILLLNIHLTLLALLLAGQVCLAAAVAAYDAEDSKVVPDDRHAFSSTAWEQSLEVDSVGASLVGVVHLQDSASLRRELREALLSYKWADTVALIVEVLTLLLGCMLHSAYMRADERAEDLEEGLLDTSAPLLTSSGVRHGPRTAPPGRATLPPRVVRDDPWSTRMREQYGLDTSILSYNPQQPRSGGGAGAGGGAASAGGGGGGGASRAGEQGQASGRCIIS